jgi:hypothetical protein
MSAPTNGQVSSHAADIITNALTGKGLTHPGNPEQKQPPTTIPLPFRTTGMPPQLAQQVQTTTRLLAEAIVHLLETEGHLTLIPTTELDQLRETAAEPYTGPTVAIYCPHGQPVLEIAARPHIRLHAAQLAALTEAAQCRH